MLRYRERGLRCPRHCSEADAPGLNLRRRSSTDKGACDAGNRAGRGLCTGGRDAVAYPRWGRKAGRDRGPSQALTLPHTARRPAQGQDVLSRSTQGRFMLGLFSLEKRFWKSQAIPEGSCGRGEGLATSWSPVHSVQGHGPHPLPSSHI